MILDRCPRCKRPNREFCERLGRPCERKARTITRKPPRYGDGQREALRRHWAEKAEVYQQEKAAYLARRAGGFAPTLAQRVKPPKRGKSDQAAAHQREYDRNRYDANRDEINARRREKHRKRREHLEARKAVIRRFSAA